MNTHNVSVLSLLSAAITEIKSLWQKLAQWPRGPLQPALWACSRIPDHPRCTFCLFCHPLACPAAETQKWLSSLQSAVKFAWPLEIEGGKNHNFSSEKHVLAKALSSPARLPESWQAQFYEKVMDGWITSWALQKGIHPACQCEHHPIIFKGLNERGTCKNVWPLTT